MPNELAIPNPKMLGPLKLASFGFFFPGGEVGPVRAPIFGTVPTGAATRYSRGFKEGVISGDPCEFDVFLLTKDTHDKEVMSVLEKEYNPLEFPFIRFLLNGDHLWADYTYAFYMREGRDSFVRMLIKFVDRERGWQVDASIVDEEMILPSGTRVIAEVRRV